MNYSPMTLKYPEQVWQNTNLGITMILECVPF